MWNGKDYAGICAACFEPVKLGDEMKFSNKGRTFHTSCAKINYNSYYVALERIEASLGSEYDPTALMNEMERIFKIPALNDEAFNEDNKEVIELYRKISNLRFPDGRSNELRNRLIEMNIDPDDIVKNFLDAPSASWDEKGVYNMGLKYSDKVWISFLNLVDDYLKAKSKKALNIK